MHILKRHGLYKKHMPCPSIERHAQGRLLSPDKKERKRIQKTLHFFLPFDFAPLAPPVEATLAALDVAAEDRLLSPLTDLTCLF